jgi:hypothetical protein
VCDPAAGESDEQVALKVTMPAVFVIFTGTD